MRTFGECSVEISGVRRILRGDVEIMNAGLETGIEANMDASVYQTAKSKPVVLKLSLEDALNARLTHVDMITAKDVTFVEEMAGATHFLSSAKIAGEPSYDPSTGAITGISFACQRANYRYQPNV